MSQRQARMQLRVSPQVKRDLERAAELTHVNLTDFTIKSAHKKALKIIKENETIMLSNAERDHFLALIENPPEPNKKLSEAMKKFLRKK